MENTNWIPVEERLPEVGLSVLFCHSEERWVVAGYLNRKGNWVTNTITGLKPTHWMEFPEAP